ncbi:MAG: hypothetical protein WC047_06650 [Kiritimatiellales bacterium]
MPFLPGKSGNPAGRPKGAATGRMLALDTLDGMLSDETTLESLREGLEKALDRDPAWFFRRIIMPLLPKEATLSLENNGEFKWKLLTDTLPIEDSSEFISRKQDSALSAPAGDLERPSALPERLPSGES